MQPYFFPYVGYFQLMHAVDVFVFYDEAQYMKGGWVNRNRILRDGAPAWWTFPIVRDDYRLPIAQRLYSADPADAQGLLDKLDNAYRRAPCHAATRALVAQQLGTDERRVSVFNRVHLEAIARSLGLRCRFLASSEIEHDRGLHGQARVLELCRRLGASRYVNAIGGLDLYDAEAFARAGVELAFVQARPPSYAQFGQAHVSSLSIVDVLMFNPPEQAQALLPHYRLLPGKAAA